MTTRWPFHDFGGDGPTVIALHGHFGSSETFRSFARQLSGRLHIVAPDQVGHGSAPAHLPLSPATYVDRMIAFIEQHSSGPVHLYGHSMGGTHALLIAAARPELVKSLILEEGAAVVGPAVLDQSGWAVRASTFLKLADMVRAQGIEDPYYFLESAVRFSDGWGFPFDYAAMKQSQLDSIGDYSKEWASTTAPALLIRGKRSRLFSGETADRMAAARPGVRLAEFEAGHWVHNDALVALADVVAEFVYAND
ncbi:alpha/beta fold hydrolase [Nocardia carnea]|uniref:alpha/beta fold hydrolase n=1 Tax=Nocardia carnea TaxID=37328 RepID=UPI0024585DF3|nr:alpha/beta hydrolase [Nocardia carnea]